MTGADILLLAVALFVVAVLYSSVGHAGASGYIAVMALLGLVPGAIKPTALTLNIVVALITFVQFYRAGHFSWPLFRSFAIASVPCSFIGGRIGLSLPVFHLLLGATLLFAAGRFLFETKPDARPIHEPPISVALLAGAGIGLLSGLTGVGGGIFLTPLLLLFAWAPTQRAAAVSSLFILVNSVAGLAGHLSSMRFIPNYIPWLILSVVAGGMIGSYLGSSRLPVLQIRRILAVVLVIAGVKLLLP